MNQKFNGNITIKTKKTNKPRGYSSAAAKQAFADMRKDKSMWVHCETILGDILQPFILNESILCY